MHAQAHVLRPVRVDEKANEFIFYTGTTFPKNPYQGCERIVRTLRFLGMLSNEKTNLVLDVLDAEGDVIEDYNLTKHGFEFLRKKLKFVRELQD